MSSEIGGGAAAGAGGSSGSAAAPAAGLVLSEEEEEEGEEKEEEEEEEVEEEDDDEEADQERRAVHLQTWRILHTRIESLLQGTQLATGGGAAVGAGGFSAAPTDGWIDPDLLEIKFQDCVCALCFGLMVEPMSGCPEGHCCCRACYIKALREKRECPVCRYKTDGLKLVRARPVEGVISQLRLRCENAEGKKGNETPGSAPAASMTFTELRQRGLDSTGTRPGLVARLEENRQKDAGCVWRGRVGELPAHLGECGWVPVKCANEGCKESPLRKDLPEHKATCEHRAVKCGHCETELKSRLLAEHEGRCSYARIECPDPELSCVLS